MRHTIAFLLLLCLATPLQAQRGAAITTSTDFSVLATDGTTADLVGQPAGFDIGRGLRITASAGDRENGAQAAILVMPILDPRLGLGVSIREHGRVWNTVARGGGLAGTSQSTPRTRPVQGPHGIQVAYRVQPGTTGTVYVHFDGDASQNAFAGASIDVDGDGQADFSARASGQRQGARIPVQAGRAGLVVSILTSGQAALQGQGREAYGVGLSVVFREDGGSTGGCGFRSFGSDCGAHLEGQVVRTSRGAAVELTVSSAPANGFGIMVAGDLLGRPMPLPFSRCDLLVDPRGVLHGFLLDRAGGATVRFPLPSAPGYEISFQALALGFDPQRNPQLATSNGQHLGCR